MPACQRQGNRPGRQARPPRKSSSAAAPLGRSRSARCAGAGRPQYSANDGQLVAPRHLAGAASG